jgi:hypothetical protein
MIHHHLLSDVMLYLDKVGHLSQPLNSIRIQRIQVQVHQDIQKLLPRMMWVGDQYLRLHQLVAELGAFSVGHSVVGVLVLRRMVMILLGRGR